MNESTIGVIPARLESTRLPRKLLRAETGKPLLRHTWERATACAALERVVIATDSEEIFRVAGGFGAEAVMTGEHQSGTDRVAEVVAGLGLAGDAIVVNVQGDEPEVDAGNIGLIVSALRGRPECDMATLAAPIESPDFRDDPACVKVVTRADGRALYFSRLPIPFARDGTGECGPGAPWRLHVGLYAYRAAFLARFTRYPASTLETAERLEQLRALECGAEILVADCAGHSGGIDTPEQYGRFVARFLGSDTDEAAKAAQASLERLPD